jgi:hypothetical protein
MFSVNAHFKEVKVVYFDGVLEVLILSSLPCHRLAQEFMGFSPEMKQEPPPGGGTFPKRKTAARLPPATMTSIVDNIPTQSEFK